jgi:hypothetical protein
MEAYKNLWIKYKMVAGALNIEYGTILDFFLLMAGIILNPIFIRTGFIGAKTTK